MAKDTLDPSDWESFRLSAHTMLDQVLNKMEAAKTGPVWNKLPDEKKKDFDQPLPQKGLGVDVVRQKITELLPYGVGNTHPRFFGWVHGAGNAGGIFPEMAAAAMNANVGGRDHGAIYVEKQVIDWCRQIMGFPLESSGLIVSGTSMATIIAIKVARDQFLDTCCRENGLAGAELVGYASEQSHSCLSRAFDILGIGSKALRKIPCDQNFQMDIDSLKSAIIKDRNSGKQPFLIIGTAGSVNVGAIDDLDALADLSLAEGLWLHVDGAFGSTAILSESIRPKLIGLERAHSLAFDFHKWLQVNYDAGCVLIHSKEKHLQSFAGRAEYLVAGEALAAGSPWPVDFGPELSRGFRALKVWSHLIEHGVEKLGAVISKNCKQAAYLSEKIKVDPCFELLAPVMLNIVCFRYLGGKDIDNNNLNRQIVRMLQESGVAAPSTTTINGKLAIRVNITNHRTEFSDLDILLNSTRKIGKEISQH